MSAEQWDPVCVLRVGPDTTGAMLLDTEMPVTVGRSARAGLRSPSENAHVPRELASLRRTRSGWVLTNEGNTVGRSEVPVRVRGPFLPLREGALFAPHAIIVLQRGDWTIEWDLDVKVVLTLKPRGDEDRALPVARDQEAGQEGMGTLLPEPLILTASQRRRMAALFAHLVLGEAPPKNLMKAAALLLGEHESQIRTAFTNVKRKVNASPFRRHADPIDSLEDLGRYLVEVNRMIGPDDLEDSVTSTFGR